MSEETSPILSKQTFSEIKVKLHQILELVDRCLAHHPGALSLARDINLVYYQEMTQRYGNRFGDRALEW